MIFSKAANVLHVPYPEGHGALRVSLEPERGSFMETLAFYFPMVGPGKALLMLHWGETIPNSYRVELISTGGVCAMGGETAPGIVTVRGGAEGFAQEITAGRHRLIAAEPVSAGGTDRVPQCASRDSNAGPSAPEADALSS